MEGAIRDTSVTFQLDDDRLSWQEDSGTEPTQLPLKSIVNLVPSHQEGSKSEYIIVYVEQTPSANGSDSELQLQTQSVLASGLPTQFVEKFQSKQSLWNPPANGSNEVFKARIVVSTGSGTGLAEQWWKQLVRPALIQHDFFKDDYQLHFTTSENSICDLFRDTIWPQARKGVSQLVLLLSGDGGIVDTVNTLLQCEPTGPRESYKKPVITLLPAGTGNALANSAVVGSDNTKGLRTMFCGTSKEVPVFRVTFSDGARLLVNEGQTEQYLAGKVNGKPVAHGAVVFSWGLHATLVADSDTTEYRKFGSERFQMAGKEALFPSDGSTPHAYKGKVSVIRPGKEDWEVVPRDTHGYILATLVSNLEATFVISPASTPLDGKLRLIHFGHLSGNEAMEVMTQAYQGGKHIKNPNVGYEQIEALRIEFGEEDARWRRVCTDGKIVRVEKGGHVEVRMGVPGVVDLISRDD